jgi:hypothetical protein
VTPSSNDEQDSVSTPDTPVLMAQNKQPAFPGRTQTAQAPAPSPQTTSQRWASAPDTLPPDATDADPASAVAQTGYRNPAALSRYPANVAQNAKMLADYVLPVNSYQLARSPIWVQAAQAAYEYDPSFNAAQYDIRKSLNNSFASGKDSQALQSINRTVKHLGDLRDTVKALNNPTEGEYSVLTSPVSQAKTWLERKSGDPRPGRFDFLSNAAASEMVGATRGSGGAEKDVERWKQGMNAADPQSVQMGNIDTAVDILSGIAASAREKYIKGMGRPPQNWQFLDPRSRQVLAEMGFDPDKIEHGVKASEAKLPPSAKNLQTVTNQPDQQTPNTRQSIMARHGLK